ncbi:L-threonylcarbamoyladenylate synthase [Dysosmobacter sp.]|uniref:L-threonylcarbamoyladenylate synthase n=1 Tax=Dysosmobacter sp. TaxID=2591382 RepID=UPI002A8A5971|nr:L-threonylcarbamoyladenylate synthase [Dysosmobacter sp.]MDY3984605.1 L-threonylcarbamoyladenylate synthase [Dysosmobacter sp.]
MHTLYFDLRDTKGQQKEIEDKIAAAAKILREGGLVAIPTETVYGLGANGLDGEAVQRIFEAKGRPNDNPLILHVTGQQWLPRYCRDVPPIAYVLARKFWPGPLTMILKRKPVVPDETTAGLDTVAMRCPNHPVTLAIIREAGVPIAAPSANTSGRPSCTSAQDVLEDMDGKIQGVVDGGPCTVGVESTILDLTCEPPRLLRPGGLPLEDLERLIGHIDVDKAVTGALKEGEKPKAPGMKYRHYAPKAPVTVITGAPEKSAREIQKRITATSGVICFDEFAHLFREQEVHTLGPSGDKLTQAQRVFDALRTFDNSAVTEIFAQCPDNRGLGLAVGNRLKKAAGFHVIEADSERVVLGLTGGTGAGKTSALRAIESLGGTVIDCDQVYHRMLTEDEDLRRDIHNAFPSAFTRDGVLGRQKLGQEVFSDKERLAQLNEIVYCHIIPELRRMLEEGTGDLFAIDAINLLEAGVDQLCDRTVAITAPAELRVRRIMARDGITEQYARLRISAQKPDEYYRGKCDLELNNAADSPETFESEAREFFQRLIETVKEEKQHGTV